MESGAPKPHRNMARNGHLGRLEDINVDAETPKNTSKTGFDRSTAGRLPGITVPRLTKGQVTSIYLGQPLRPIR